MDSVSLACKNQVHIASKGSILILRNSFLVVDKNYSLDFTMILCINIITTATVGGIRE